MWAELGTAPPSRLNHAFHLTARTSIRLAPPPFNADWLNLPPDRAASSAPPLDNSDVNQSNPRPSNPANADWLSAPSMEGEIYGGRDYMEGRIHGEGYMEGGIYGVRDSWREGYMEGGIYGRKDTWGGIYG